MPSWNTRVDSPKCAAPYQILMALCLAGLALVLIAEYANAEPKAKLVWRSGFEKGFPSSEWSRYDNGSFLPSGKPIAGRKAAWAIIGKRSFAKILAGSSSYKGWVIESKKDSKTHRAYPGLQTKILSPLVNSFWVYIDVDYENLQRRPGGRSDWISFATYSNDPEWNDVFTLSINQRGILHMHHLNWKHVQKPKPFPVQRWVRITVYIDFGSGEVVVWQDGKRVLTGNYDKGSEDALRQAHWGMYSNNKVSSGIMFNDEVAIWTLSEPWKSEQEPPAPYKIKFNAGALSTP